MLKSLLMEIKNADYISKEHLAVQLGQPVSLIEDGFRELIRMGYLSQEAGLNCNDLPCGKCPYASMCSKNPRKTWALTEKGKRVLA
ncbi:MAG TPA: hypothetical protein DDW87_13755 [Firmicutes bacterium]|nr:hypothetical protein [Bacillota bacterium]